MNNRTELRHITSRDQYTDDMADSLMALLSKGMRSSARIRAVRGFCNMACYSDTQSRLKSWMTERIYFDSEGMAHYCAGQSYPDEIRAIVNMICK